MENTLTQKELNILLDKNNINNLNEKEKNNIIKNKLIYLINNLNNKNIDSISLLNKNQQSKLCINNYLYYCLIALNARYKNDEKLMNKNINKSLELDKMKSSFIYLVIGIKLSNYNLIIKWFNKYMECIKNYNDYLTIRLIDYIHYNSMNKELDILVNNNIKKILKYYNTSNEKIKLKEIFKFNSDIKTNYIYIKKYCDNHEELIEELIQTSSYNKIYDKFHNIVYENNYTTYYNELLEYLFNNNNEKYYNLTDILIDKKISSSFKEIIVKYLTNDIKEILNNKNNDKLNITINKWKNSTNNGENEKELIKNLENYIDTSYENEIKKIKIIDFKVIYSLIFTLLGIIFLLFSNLIGTTILFVGIIGSLYFIFINKYYIKTLNNEKEKIKQIAKEELYNLLAEIVDIKLIIKDNIKYKNLLINLLNTYNTKIKEDII